MMTDETTPDYRMRASARRDAVSSISAIAYGFMGSQALFTALELGLFTTLEEEPGELHDLAARLKAPSSPLNVLLSTCLALDLVTWDGERYANSPLAQRFLVKTARGYVGDYYLRQVSFLIYDRLPLVRQLLREQPVETLDYAHTLATPHMTEEFIRGQHAGSLGPAALLARTYDFSTASRLLDLGGGSGAFAIEVAKRFSSVSAIVFDLPQVINVTEQIIQEAGLTDRITCARGDLRTAPWPEGADLILLSYVVSCYGPETLRALLARTLAYLPSGGRILLHDFALHSDRRGPYNAALFLFGQLAGSAQTHAYTVDELAAALHNAGYLEVTAQPFLPDLTFLVSGRKP
jgi:precorrin-6B methylase 2